MVGSLVEAVLEEAENLALVMDNLSTDRLVLLHEAFAPERARQIAEVLDIQYRAEHGSWLSMAGTELAVLTQQCLCRRIQSSEVRRREVAVHHGGRPDLAPLPISGTSIEAE